jgi:mono/diheme cytochrome c family protein
MKRLVKAGALLIILTAVFLLWTGDCHLRDDSHLWLFFYRCAAAQEPAPSAEDIIQGALLYDKWYAALGTNPPQGEMPIWSRQSTNTRSGADTWRCSECHGWDTRGAAGAYGSGSHFTGFPDLLSLLPELDSTAIVEHLKGTNDPAHDFSAYLDEASLNQLAAFLKFGAIDDAPYIDPISLRVINADAERGRSLFDATCQACHGEDGKTIVFRSEGINETLGSVAHRDPWRFLHRTRFGVAGTEMPVGYALGWTPEEGRDILAYVQTLPTGGEIAVSETYQPAESLQNEVPAGPANNLFSGILTGLAAFTGGIGYAVLFIGGFLLLGFLVVFILGRRK